MALVAGEAAASVRAFRVDNSLELLVIFNRLARIGWHIKRDRRENTEAITEELSVLYDGRPIGRLAVTQRTPRKILGRFTPGADFDACRARFEEAAKWFSQWEGTSVIPEMDYVAWNQWIEVIGEITARISLPEVSQSIEEFAVDNTSEVEVTLFV